MSETYQRLMACAGGGDPFDRHVFACILAKGLSQAPRPLTNAVGLDLADLHALFAAYFPEERGLLDGEAEQAGPDAIEEADFRTLLVSNATRPDSAEARWLAAMVVRRSLEPDHLWQDLGVSSRTDLSGLLMRHFQPLAARNVRDMKWKKFFYREMCAAEGMTVCKSPICDTCTDFAICFGPEDGT